jgi:hypothetical protein
VYDTNYGTNLKLRREVVIRFKPILAPNKADFVSDLLDNEMHDMTSVWMLMFNIFNMKSGSWIEGDFNAVSRGLPLIYFEVLLQLNTLLEMVNRVIRRLIVEGSRILHTLFWLVLLQPFPSIDEFLVVSDECWFYHSLSVDPGFDPICFDIRPVLLPWIGLNTDSLMIDVVELTVIDDFDIVGPFLNNFVDFARGLSFGFMED